MLKAMQASIGPWPNCTQPKTDNASVMLWAAVKQVTVIYRVRSLVISSSSPKTNSTWS